MPGELLAAYDRERLRSLSADRRCTAVRVLNDYASQPDATCSSGEALRAFLQAQAAAGYADGTMRKARAIVLAYAAWCWREGQVSGDQLLELRAVRPPIGSGARAQPEPYRLGELRELRRVLDLRWPRLPDDEARRWVERWRDGRSPYSRLRTHAIRMQLDAIIDLALRCGLRRDEIFRLGAEWIEPDNAYIVVWDEEGPWRGKHRTVPYTDSAREAIRPWVRLRRRINPAHACAWLSLWSAETVREPMTRYTFDRLLRTYVGDGWTFRRLRATCIVNWIRAGLQLEDLRDALGYRDIAELLPYARCVGGDAGRAMDRLDERFREIAG